MSFNPKKSDIRVYSRRIISIYRGSGLFVHEFSPQNPDLTKPTFVKLERGGIPA